MHAKRYVAGQEKDCLYRQITEPVRWTQTVEFLLDRGEMNFLELGPGRVLTKLIDAIRSNRVRAAA